MSILLGLGYFSIVWIGWFGMLIRDELKGTGWRRPYVRFFIGDFWAGCVALVPGYLVLAEGVRSNSVVLILAGAVVLGSECAGIFYAAMVMTHSPPLGTWPRALRILGGAVSGIVYIWIVFLIMFLIPCALVIICAPTMVLLALGLPAILAVYGNLLIIALLVMAARISKRSAVKNSADF